MEEAIHVTFSEFDKEISWTVSFLKGVKKMCIEDENRMKAVQLLIEETDRIKESSPREVR